MRVITGPAGSGKTAMALEAVRSALRSGREDVRLLVPTATLSEHVQNAFAREGFVFRRSVVQTLSGFVESLTRDLRQASEPVLYLIVEEAAKRVARPEFARVVGMPGFCATLARTIAEFSSAGCDSARLASRLPDAPLAAAFLSVYREVERELEHRGLVQRARRLEAAAERIEGDGLPGIAEIWLDGFHALPDPELRVVAALSRKAQVTLTIGDDELDDRIAALAEHVERRTKSRTSPAVQIVVAPGVERECEEIARRILEQAAVGRPFREIGVIVRPAEAYAPILESTLERFGIPARFYFDRKMERHREARFVTAAVEAMLGGWDHGATLAAMRLAPGFEDSAALDRADFVIREHIPDAGLERLRESGAPGELIDRLAGLDAWRELQLEPREWAEQVATWAQARVIGEALEEAAEALEKMGQIRLTPFWRAAKAVLRLSPLRERDGRRNVVQVMSAHEARQWVLPVVFVCGMVEKQFPQFHRQDPFFPEGARRALNAGGVRVRTAAQFEREERALFDSAVTRGTISVTLTYPEFDARGDRNLPSLFLDSFALPAERSRAVRPAARAAAPPAAAPAIRAPELLSFIGGRTAKIAPTTLENFLKCPFRCFGGNILRLRPAPKRPEKRLDFMTQGSIVHDVLKAWWNERGDIAATFEDVFARVAAEKRIQAASYQTERARNLMLDDLRKFAADDQWPRGEYASQTEQEFEFELSEGVTIRGKIDRLDVARDGRAVVIDYKYSNSQRLKARIADDNLLQAPLYLLAAERKFGHAAGAMYYIGLKGGVLYESWETFDGWRERAAERTLAVIGEIRGGRIDVAPVDRDDCRFCDSKDICRVETEAVGGRAAAEGA